MFDSSGLSGPPYGVPRLHGLATPPAIIPFRR